MKTIIPLTVITAILFSAIPVFAQRMVDPNELKISPAKYKNQTINLIELCRSWFKTRHIK